MVFFVSYLLELFKQRDHIELNLFTDLGRHIYLSLYSLIVYIL